MKKYNKYIFLYMIIQIVVFASNPLEKYITDEVYETSLKKFSSKKSIFNEKIYSLDAIKKERAESIRKMESIFLRTVVISKNTTGKWLSTFYYKDELGEEKRKTVLEREKMEIGESVYLVTAYSEGIKVKDLETKYEIKLKRKGR